MKTISELRARLIELGEDRKSMVAIRAKLCIGISRIDNDLVGNKGDMRAVAELLLTAIERERPKDKEVAA